MRLLESLKRRARRLRTETYALYFAYRDPRVPWYAKVFMGAVIGYALSPVDLVPDFIPVLGYLDDLIIVPAGVYLALKMVPREVMEECRARAEHEGISSRVKWVAAAVIVAVWLLVLYLLFRLLWRLFGR